MEQQKVTAQVGTSITRPPIRTHATGTGERFIRSAQNNANGRAPAFGSGAQCAQRCLRSVEVGVLDDPVERVVTLARCVEDAAPYDAGVGTMAEL